jgi:Adenylate and Guanylate cyclase catalytic domain
MMKRAAIFAAVIGIAVAALVSAAHALGLLAPAETPLLDWMQRAEVPPRVLGNVWQYLFIVPVSLAVAWLTLITSRRHRVGWLLLAFVAEMLVLVWVGSLYHLFFQPIPTVVAAVVAYALAIGYLAWEARPHLPKSVPLTAPGTVTALASAPGVPAIAPVIASAPKPVLTTPMLLPRREIPKKEAVPKSPEPKQPEPVPRGPEQAVPNMAPQPERPPPEQTFAGAPDLFEATVLVCDLAEKYDLADNSEPAAAARALAKFCQRATDLLLKAGGHLHKADGEGVVALFGFPQTMPGHAEQAVRAAFELNRAFSSGAHSSNGDNVVGGGAHIGVSSGAIVAGHSEGKPDLFVLGEAVELAPLLSGQSLLRVAYSRRPANIRAGELDRGGASDRFPHRRDRPGTARNLRAAGTGRGCAGGLTGPARFVLEWRRALPGKTLGRSSERVSKSAQ